VHEIGLLSTFDTPDNVRTFIGNKIFRHNSELHGHLYRRVELTARFGSRPTDGDWEIEGTPPAVANVSKTPAPDVTILTFNPSAGIGRATVCHATITGRYFDANMCPQVSGITRFLTGLSGGYRRLA
jgi:hypothetical protein